MLIGLRRIVAARGGELYLAACADPVLQLLEITALTVAFTIRNTVAEAVAAAAP
jgi:hypothetical protein